MFKTFKIQGFGDWVRFFLAVMGTLCLTVALPSFLMQVVWNALVFERFHGPEVTFWQGVLLWAISLVFFQLIFRPEIHFSLHPGDDPNVKPPTTPQSKGQ